MADKRRPKPHTRNEWHDRPPASTDVRAAQKLAKQVSPKLLAMMEAKTKGE